MTPISSDGRFIPGDFLTFKLPASATQTAVIDLTVSPGWKPGTSRWLVHLLSKDTEANAGFGNITFVEASPLTTIFAFARNTLRQEPYTPSSYHALRGYRALSMDLTVIAGILLLITCFVTAFFSKREHKLTAILLIILTFQGIYGLRFGLDILRFSAEHLIGSHNGIYDEAGSVYRIADALRDQKAQSVFICRSGTNYKEKLLRYFVYPIHVTADSADASHADSAVVMSARDWRFEHGTLRCGAITMQAQKITDFNDGSVLFSLHQ
jgi:hypothetical protein